MAGHDVKCLDCSATCLLLSVVVCCYYRVHGKCILSSVYRVTRNLELGTRAFRSELLTFTSFGCGRQALDVAVKLWMWPHVLICRSHDDVNLNVAFKHKFALSELHVIALVLYERTLLPLVLFEHMLLLIFEVFQNEPVFCSVVRQIQRPLFGSSARNIDFVMFWLADDVESLRNARSAMFNLQGAFSAVWRNITWKIINIVRYELTYRN